MLRKSELAALALAALLFLAGLEIRDVLVASLAEPEVCPKVPYSLSARPRCVRKEVP